LPLTGTNVPTPSNVIHPENMILATGPTVLSFFRESERVWMSILYEYVVVTNSGLYPTVH
jgi:hypothetical protein